jgi:hypothetical protein
LPLNGLSPHGGNPRLGFELVKIGRAVPDRRGKRRRIRALLTLDKANWTGASVPPGAVGQNFRQKAHQNA